MSVYDPCALSRLLRYFRFFGSPRDEEFVGRAEEQGRARGVNDAAPPSVDLG